MASYGGVIVTYGTDPEHPSTYKQYYTIAGGASDWLGGFVGPVDMSTYTPSPSVGNASAAALLFIAALEQVAKTGVQVFGVRADWRASAGPSVVEAEDDMVISNFIPIGGVAGYGPYKKGFVAVRQRVPGSRRPGWLRFHQIGATCWTKTTIGPASRFSDRFETCIEGLSATAGSVANYAIWSGFPATANTWVLKTPPDPTYVRLGDVNG